MKKNNECVIRNFVAHSSQTVRFNSGKHKNKKRISVLKGRYAKHKKVLRVLVLVLLRQNPFF